jgi:hypothetical protein
LLGCRVDAAQELCLVVRECVHRVDADVEAAVCVVDREHVDRLAVVRERPTGPAARRVPPGDRLGAADVRKLRQTAFTF